MRRNAHLFVVHQAILFKRNDRIMVQRYVFFTNYGGGGCDFVKIEQEGIGNIGQQKNGEVLRNFSIHFECLALSGDPLGTRTQDPYIKSVLLYQLS